ncbi:SDR family oxidoreductase [Flavobacterium sp.]|uniref:SDR family oxidoreductase n=1 Tax=Flavobacterium sp. TaxID=239 RepID=UPI0026277108|nr:SDR family oxidoreductase [Flavobacterium sp.]
MILVTGATGNLGKATIDFLLKKGIEAGSILALVRDKQAASDFENKGIGVVEGDYNNYASLVTAFKGVEQLFFISGSDLEKRLTQHHNIIEAAKEARVKHVVYTSFQRTNETETSPLWLVAQSHIQTEQWLKESDLEYTILKNNLYMDFLPAFIGEKVLDAGVIYVPAESGKVSAVLRSEMAEAAATILSTTGHGGKEYDFTNAVAVSYQEIAQWISEVSGTEIQYHSPTVEEYGATLRSYGVPEEVIGIFSSFAIAQAEGELAAVNADLELLLGRKPLSIEAFIKNLYAPKE